VWLAVAAIGLAGCAAKKSSADSDDLVFFEAGECKENSGLGEVYAGLKCIAWDTTDPEVTKIDLFNFEEDCSIDWQGEASVEPDGTVELRMVNPGCAGSDCVPCYWDFNFGVANVPANDELALRLLVGVWICPDEDEEPDPSRYETSLPQGSEPKGAICEYAAEGEYAIPGTVFMGCRAPEDPDPPCDQGLACAVGGENNEPLCHPTCEVDDDCPWGGVLACEDGLCRPANPW
jgi:hypothetical protein